jgi:4,5-dihydroxyphthalate decarboxylase
MAAVGLKLRIGCGDYDRTKALFDGSVKAEGIDIDWTPVNVPHTLFVRVLQGEFDVAEMSLSGLTNGYASGTHDLVGIPVFTSRLFRHSFIFVNTDSGISEPKDLIGKRMGVTDYTVTAAVWMRGLLEHDYGVAPDQMEWFLGGLDEPGKVIPLAPKIPGSVKIEQMREGISLGDALESGELDAVMTPGMPRVIKQRAPHVRRLFPNFHEVEADYFRRTGIVPIMHVLAVRRAIYEANPWMAASLFRGFTESKRRSYEWLQETGAPRTTLTWLQAYLDEERRLFGEDFWPYGIEPNRKTLEAFMSYVYEQGLCDRLVSIDELFARETLAL